MKLVVGLGNPGKKYDDTRHNVGFAVVARLAQVRQAATATTRFHSQVSEYRAAPGPVLLLSPSTFMNRSGQAVRAAFDFYKLELTDLLVICDDLNLPLGKLRIRARGSAGGQKGLADIIRSLGSDEFARLRVGIGAPPTGWDAADFVLSRFTRQDEPIINDAIDEGVRAVEDWVEYGAAFCMNRYNSGKDVAGNG